MSYTVIGSGISPFVRKVLAVMEEKGLEFRIARNILLGGPGARERAPTERP